MNYGNHFDYLHQIHGYPKESKVIPNKEFNLSNQRDQKTDLSENYIDQRIQDFQFIEQSMNVRVG